MADLAGKTILHYHILKQIGQGGMGIVYLAEDTKLDRRVAIKFLPGHITGNSDERKRFEVEAKAAAALNHPNIATIYAIEYSDDENFIVMEYIDGQELKERLKSGPLNVDEAIHIAEQIAQGLEAAHEKNIIHRDIKSSNIMITVKGNVKIMDFGLAKLGKGIQLTKEHSTLGTAPYMSPEQMRGDAVDHRSDIWSFGVVLYEMFTGQLPFKGDYEQAIAYSVLNEKQQPVTRLQSEIPVELERTVNKCLLKDITHRYQHFDEIITDLRQIKNDFITSKHRDESNSMKEASPKRKRSFVVPGIIGVLIVLLIAVYYFFSSEPESTERIPIAVADFINQTNEPELNGLSGMLITALEQSRRLAVLTRSRMFDILEQMNKKDIDKIDESLGRQICRTANIHALVVASIRKFGKLYSIDLKVIDPDKNEYLFTAREEGEGQERIPSMLDNLSEKTRVGLKEKITQVKEYSQSIASVTTANLDAYQHYFQGEQFINQVKFEQAINEFKEAVALDSTFAQAYYRLAYAESWKYESEVIQKSHLDRALRNINRIPERERYLVRAQNAITTNDYKSGISILKEMEEKYPNDKEMIYNIGDWSYHLGEFPTAVMYLEKTLKIDPNHRRALQHLTWVYRDMNNHQKMLTTAKRYVAVSGSAESYQLLGGAYTQSGQLEEGIRVLQQARELFPNIISITNSIADLFIYMDNYLNAETELKKLIDTTQKINVRRYGYEKLAELYPYTGNYRKAIKLADKALELSWQNGDTTRALNLHLLKAFLLLFGWNDIDKAWNETEKTLPYNEKITNLPYWGSFNLMQVYHGDYNDAIRVTEKISLKWHYYQIRSLIYCSKHDEKNAVLYADSAFKTNPDFSKIIILYPLADFQYEEGSFANALESLKELQELKDNNFWWRSAYYPKSFYLMGKIYEEKGDTKSAIRSYQKFLDLWKNADEDLPDLIDAKKRLAGLKGVS